MNSQEPVEPIDLSEGITKYWIDRSQESWKCIEMPPSPKEPVTVEHASFLVEPAIEDFGSDPSIEGITKYTTWLIGQPTPAHRPGFRTRLVENQFDRDRIKIPRISEPFVSELQDIITDRIEYRSSHRQPLTWCQMEDLPTTELVNYYRSSRTHSPVVPREDPDSCTEDNSTFTLGEIGLAPTGDWNTTCTYYVRSAFLHCTVNPKGPCQGCKHYENSEQADLVGALQDEPTEPEPLFRVPTLEAFGGRSSASLELDENAMPDGIN